MDVQVELDSSVLILGPRVLLEIDYFLESHCGKVSSMLRALSWDHLLEIESFWEDHVYEGVFILGPRNLLEIDSFLESHKVVGADLGSDGSCSCSESHG